MKTIYIIPTLLASAFLQSVAQASNARDDFSIASNPNGAWSYGWTPTLAGTFTVFANKVTSGDQSYWYGDSPAFGGAAGYPIVGVTNALVPANTLVEHPGPLGEYAVLRWTAPIDETVNLLAQFGVGDTNPTTTDVHILLNGISLTSGIIDGTHIALNFAHTVALVAGDKIDFTVGYGQNGNYLFDSTFILADISAVPEPSSMALIFAGMGLILFKAKRNKTFVRGEA